jgi:uncharacterized protein
MKRAILYIFVTVFATLSALCATYTADNLPNVRKQDATRYVVNPDNILSAQVTDSIDALLLALEKKTGIETVVAVVESIGDTECFDFCHSLLNGWGVGKKDKNNGLIVLLVTDQRCIQFYTGYGLEGDMPDAICKRIQTVTMLPYLKEADWDNAMLSGMKAVCDILDGSMTADDLEDDDDDEGFIVCIVVMLMVMVGGGMVVWGVWKESQCPQCGKHELMRTNSVVVSRRNGVCTEEVTYTCRNCGHTLKRRQDSYDDNYRGGRGGGPIIFGSGGGGGGFGGGSIGGSFGGGMGGGGGAGTHF